MKNPPPPPEQKLCHLRRRLVVAAELRKGEELMHLGNIGDRFTAAGKLAGQDAPWRPVLGHETYPSSWQAWRIGLKASSTPQPFELRLAPKTSRDVELTFTGHFVPQ